MNHQPSGAGPQLSWEEATSSEGGKDTLVHACCRAQSAGGLQGSLSNCSGVQVEWDQGERPLVTHYAGCTFCNPVRAPTEWKHRRLQQKAVV